MKSFPDTQANRLHTNLIRTLINLAQSELSILISVCSSLLGLLFLEFNAVVYFQVAADKISLLPDMPIILVKRKNLTHYVPEGTERHTGKDHEKNSISFFMEPI